MRKKRYSLMVRGRTKQWSFDLWAAPEHVEDWREDGLIVDELIATAPQWAFDIGIGRLWMWVDEILGYLNG